MVQSRDFQTTMAKISASLLSADFGYLADSIKAAENAGVDEFHFDVMDGHFVPNLTFGPPILEAVKRHATLPIDVHVMERSPEVMIPVLASAGGDIITVHIEGVADIDRDHRHHSRSRRPTSRRYPAPNTRFRAMASSRPRQTSIGYDRRTRIWRARLPA